MNVIVKGVHLRVSPRLRSYVDAHLVGPLLHFWNDEASELEVHLVDTNGPKGGRDKECRVTARMPGSRTLHVTERSDDIYKAVSFARDRLEKAAKREIAKKRKVAAHGTPNPAGRLARFFETG